MSITVATTATMLDAATVAALDIVDNLGPSPVVLSAGITVPPGQSRQVLVAAGTPLTATVPTGHPSSTVNITVQPGWPSDGHLQVASQIASDPTAAATLAGSTAFTSTYIPKPSITAPSSTSVPWLSISLQDLVPPQSAAQRTVAMTQTIGAEGAAVQEPSIWFDGTTYHMLYTDSAGYSRHATATTLTGSWTKGANPVIGGGAGGQSSTACHTNVYVEGSTAYAYAVDLAGATLHVYTSAITDGTTWAIQSQNYPIANVSGATEWGNSFVIKSSGTYYMVFEAANGGVWQLGLATLASPTGAMTVTNTTLPTARPDPPGGTASSSGPWIGKEGSTFIMYYHGGQQGNLPTDIYRATSTDLVNWTIDNNGSPIMSRATTKEVDQVADPFLFQAPSGQWYMFYEGMDNNYSSSYPYAAGVIYCVPLSPRTKVWDGTQWVRTATVDATPASSRPGRVATRSISTDVTTNASAYTTVASVSFTPASTDVFVSWSGYTSADSTTATQLYQLTNGTTNTPCGSFQATAVTQFATAGGAQFNRLTPGKTYTFSLQVKMSGGGTWKCRASTYPQNEYLTLKAEDTLRG